MRRIGLAVILALGLALSPLVAETQEPGKVYRVGRLSVSDAESTSSEAFRRGLRELGWVVDQNVVIEQRYAGGAGSDDSSDASPACRPGDRVTSSTSLGAALEAFILEHEYCGELDGDVEGDRV
jgi:hypothetical protein